MSTYNITTQKVKNYYSINKKYSSYLLNNRSLYYNPNRIQYLYSNTLHSDDRFFLNDDNSFLKRSILTNNQSTFFE